MPDSIGTRKVSNTRSNRNDQGSDTRSHTRDVGMAKRVTASLTFTTDGKITGANGTFSGPWAVNDPLLVDGVNLNNGYFQLTGLDAVNAAYIVVDPPPKAEGAITCTVRTA